MYLHEVCIAFVKLGNLNYISRLSNKYTVLLFFCLSHHQQHQILDDKLHFVFICECNTDRTKSLVELCGETEIDLYEHQGNVL